MKTKNTLLAIAGGLVLTFTLSEAALASTAYGDFNGDGYADLAVGLPQAHVGSMPGAGVLNLTYGSVSGLQPRTKQIFDMNVLQRDAVPKDHFGHALAVGDFDNDGFDDLAIGVPDRNVDTGDGPVPDAGVVIVMNGSGVGLQWWDKKVWHQGRLAGTNQRGDRFGRALAVGNFDGDAYDDLAIGAPFQNVGANKRDAGMVFVIHGASQGLTSMDAYIWQQKGDGGSIGVGSIGPSPLQKGGVVLGRAAKGEYFGWALVAGNFDDDAYDDLAIGVPLDRIRIPTRRVVLRGGAVNVVYGSRLGLRAKGSQFWSQATPGIKGNPEKYDSFGAVLSSGDYNGDGFMDLAVGAPNEDLRDDSSWWPGSFDTSGAPTPTGVVHIIYGSSTGLAADDPNDQLWHQDVPGIPGAPLYVDNFGEVLTSADFNADGYDDVAVGIPNDDETDDSFTSRSGAVNVIYGSAQGLSIFGNIDSQLWHQDVAGVRAVAEKDDRFGVALASGDFNGDGVADLAVEVPGENDLRGDGVGVMNILYGSIAEGLHVSGNQLLRSVHTTTPKPGLPDTLAPDPVTNPLPEKNGAAPSRPVFGAVAEGVWWRAMR